MRYQIKQRLLSLKPRFEIANEAGEPILVAVGKAFSFGANYAISALDGREFVRIRQKLLSWRPRFEVSRGDEPMATVTRQWTFRPRYAVALRSGEGLLVQGSFFEHRYQFLLGEKPVASVSREMWSLRDTYGVEVLEPRFDAVVLAVVIVIDALRNKNQNAS